MSSRANRIAVLIDGPNLHATSKRSGSTLTSSGFSQNARAAARLCELSTTRAVIEDQEYSSIRPLVDWLDYNGYSNEHGALRMGIRRTFASWRRWIRERRTPVWFTLL
jgi:hypothetical protein